MELEKVLKISGITEAQKEAARRWYKVPFNKGKELNGTASEVKEQLTQLIEQHQKNQELKAKRIEKVGSYSQVADYIKFLVEKEKVFTYKDIYTIIETAFNDRGQKVLKYRDMLDELQKMRDELGIKGKI